MANESLMANAIRALAMDAVQQANSGHPGAPMGMADISVALWNRPADQEWTGDQKTATPMLTAVNARRPR